MTIYQLDTPIGEKPPLHRDKSKWMADVNGQYALANELPDLNIREHTTLEPTLHNIEKDNVRLTGVRITAVTSVSTMIYSAHFEYSL